MSSDALHSLVPAGTGAETAAAAAAAGRGFWDWASGAPAMILGILVGAVVLRWLIDRGIDKVVDAATARAAERARRTPGRASRVLSQAAGLDHARHTQRTATTGAILKSIATFVIATLALLTIMARLGVPLAPLLASAGVGGVALGFGAQSLVKDFLSGVFMIIEDQYGVGDVVDTGEAIGTVEDVTLRVTRLRDASGVVWYIRNGEIARIGNRSQGWSTALVDIQVRYDEDLDRILPIIRDAVHELGRTEPWNERLLEEPVVAGVESVTGGVVTVRVIAKCIPNENFGVSREIRERVKLAFDRAGVQAPALSPPFGGGPTP